MPPEEESSAGKKPAKEGSFVINSIALPKRSKKRAPPAAPKNVQTIASVTPLCSRPYLFTALCRVMNMKTTMDRVQKR